MRAAVVLAVLSLLIIVFVLPAEPDLPNSDRPAPAVPVSTSR